MSEDILKLSKYYDKITANLEQNAKERLNNIITSSYQKLELELQQKYENLSLNVPILTDQRRLYIYNQLSGFMNIINPNNSKSYIDIFNKLIVRSNIHGADFAQELLSKISPDIIPFTNIPYEALAHSAERAFKYLAKHGEVFAENATTIIGQGLINGWGVKKVSQQLVKQLDITQNHAEMIASTETNAAFNNATVSRYREYKVNLVLWISVKERVCPYCSHRNGLIFNLDDILPPPLHPLCRCSISPYLQGVSTYDGKFWDSYRKKVIANSQGKVNASISPWEKQAGLKKAPQPFQLI